jgi:UPF0755 protein
VTHQEFTDTIFGDDARGSRGPSPRTRREIHHGDGRRRPPPPRRGRRLLVLAVVVALVGGGAYAAFSVLGPAVSNLLSGGSSGDMDYPGPGEGEVTIVVNPGDTGEAIATTLRENDVTKSRTAYLEAAAADPQAAATIQPGTYAMREKMSGADAFALLTDPSNRVAERVTIREGLWVDETFTTLSEATGIPVEEYEKAAEDAEAIGLPAQADGNVEGWLFPASYEFDDSTGATEQLARMVSLTKRTLEEVGVPEDEWQRTLTIASIVEGEVSGDADRGKVARVVLNRLEGGPPSYGLLQMDSTVHYAVQERGKAGTTDEQRASDSPYNTYKVQGLPPGPIGNPGKASIEAAANPTPGDWVFFVTVDPSTGETKFASTQAEHDRNVQEFNAWCADNPGQC